MVMVLPADIESNCIILGYLLTPTRKIFAIKDTPYAEFQNFCRCIQTQGTIPENG